MISSFKDTIAEEFPKCVGRILLEGNSVNGRGYATQLVLHLALEIVISHPEFSLEKIDHLGFGVMGVRWNLSGGIVSTSISFEGGLGRVELRSGRFRSGDKEVIISAREAALEAIGHVVRSMGLRQIIWA